MKSEQIAKALADAKTPTSSRTSIACAISGANRSELGRLPSAASSTDPR